MAKYVITRVILFIPTLILVSVIVFTLIQLAPGDIATIMAPNSPEATRVKIREKYGLDAPLPVQYLRWGEKFVTGEFSTSVYTGRKVSRDIWYRFPTTLELGLVAMAFTITVGTTIGVVSAWRPEGALDQILRGFAVLGLSVPVFWVATLALVLPSVLFRYHPPGLYAGPIENIVDNLRVVIPVGIVLSLNGVGRVGRLMRTTMIDVLHQDYIRTARSKGLSERTVLMSHAMRNALIPVVTLVGIEVPNLFSGAVIVEVIWGIPGMGSFIFSSLRNKDIFVILDLNMFVAMIVLSVSLAVDLLYGYLDPRIKVAH